MSSSAQVHGKFSILRHRGPHPGGLAVVYTALFLAGLYPVVSFTGGPHFPGPWESAEVIATYFQNHPGDVVLCAFLQFGAAIPLGIYTATVVSRLRFLGVRAAGPMIALFGGFATAFDIMASSHILWAMVRPGIAQDVTLLRALYFVSFGFGGAGFSVPLGLLIAGISVAAGFRRLLPRWLVIAGIVLAAIGELSWFSLVLPDALFLIPLTRFPGFLWLIAAGFLLPATATNAEASRAVAE
jgi:hypothetical protein